jgi:hypothetical protein
MITPDEMAASVLKMAHQAVEYLPDPDDRAKALGVLLDSLSKHMLGLMINQDKGGEISTADRYPEIYTKRLTSLDELRIAMQTADIVTAAARKAKKAAYDAWDTARGVGSDAKDAYYDAKDLAEAWKL